MDLVAFKIGKKFVRGDRKGKVYTETIKLKETNAIHDYLWDAAESYENNKCNYVIEWYSLKK